MNIENITLRVYHISVYVYHLLHLVSASELHGKTLDDEMDVVPLILVLSLVLPTFLLFLEI